MFFILHFSLLSACCWHLRSCVSLCSSGWSFSLSPCWILTPIHFSRHGRVCQMPSKLRHGTGNVLTMKLRSAFCKRHLQTPLFSLSSLSFLSCDPSWPCVFPSPLLARASRKSSEDVARDWFACHGNTIDKNRSVLSFHFSTCRQRITHLLYSTPLFSTGKARGQLQLGPTPNEVGRTVRQGTDISWNIFFMCSTLRNVDTFVVSFHSIVSLSVPWKVTGRLSRLKVTTSEGTTRNHIHL